MYSDDFSEEDEELGFEEELEEEEEEDMFGLDEDSPSPRRSSGSRSSRDRSMPSRAKPNRDGGASSSSRKRERAASSRYDEYDRDRYDRGSGSRQNKRYSSSSRRGEPQYGGRDRKSHGGRPHRGSGSVVPYDRRASSGAAATFTRGLTALRSYVPDASAVREAATSSIVAARETTSTLSSNLYREVKGLTSSELEQVMLKATRPDDSPVKGKHVERLVGVTYQISSRYDIYDAVLRKLWGKMAEKDWRTTIKALYILHRFSADGAPEHAPALKARLRELRRTRDPKRKDKYFNSKQLLSGDARPENVKFRAFMSRYAHYVMLRAQCFGGVFDEISEKPPAEKKSKKSQQQAPKPITSTSLRKEHLEAAAMLLKAGVACQLKDGEDCENTAIAAERVASDLIGLTTAVAIALNRALKDDAAANQAQPDPAIIKKWCEFYSEELLPQTKTMVKKTSNKLDAYGLFLPSRMGASVSPQLLQKGLMEQEEEQEQEESEDEPQEAVAASTTEAAKTNIRKKQTEEPEPVVEDSDIADEESDVEVDDRETDKIGDRDGEADEIDKDGDEYDEYEYEEEEYYDDEEL